MFLVNSRLGLFTAAPSSFGREVLDPNGAPLLPKLRDHFAEFLNEGSSDRLSILYLPTCVGFGTGTWNLPRGFSWGHGFRDFRLYVTASCLSLVAGFRPAGLRSCPSTTNLPRGFSWRHGFKHFGPKGPRRPVSGLMAGGFTYRPPYAVTPGRPSPGFP